ncbi:MAG: glycoside hydrolase family 95 protein [Lachnospiraceae bacterium]|nr:glycoside hydrolase family 95 protein [Lachnospiraceae bacterium]
MNRQNWRMEYTSPAEVWNDAVPMGNGRLGAMVYGHASAERIQLNEDSLWYGGFVDRNNRVTKEKLPLIRKKVLAGEMQEAEDLIAQYMTGAPNTMRHYEPLGELDIALNQHTPFIQGWIPNSDDAANYHSCLDLMTGIYTLTHMQRSIHFTRQMFISYPAQVLCLRITADKPGSINLDVQMDRCKIFDVKVPDHRRPGFFQRGGGWAGMLLDQNHTLDDHTLMIAGHAASTAFASAARIVTDGEMEDTYSQLLVRNASEVCIYLAGATANREKDPQAAVLQLVDKAQEKGFDALLLEHIQDFEPQMRRCTLELGSESDLPLDERLKSYRERNEDSDLAALYFTFGRYLILSGGRENSTALNLQGIWNQDFLPSWDSKYTININTEMNYWPAEVTNLSRQHQSLFDLIGRMRERGKDTARIMYGYRGAVCHHNTDYYGDCAPQDNYMAATAWTMGGAWMCLHLWEHYRFTLDKEFLREWYPTMRDFALFFLDFLMDDGTGALVTCPSLSPENRYLCPDGFDTPICAGPTMDNQILRTLFSACVESAKILNITDDPLTEQFSCAAARLPQNRIGSKGQLLEWREEVLEFTPGMGHISHLWGAYPGDEINWKDTPDLWNAVRRSLQLREDNGAGRGGWPLAWFICQHARLLNGEMTGKNIRQMIAHSSNRNFFNSGSIFQIDGNLGATAGIAESLLQSHTGILHLLPALPPEWTSGKVKGLCARGGYTIDISWDNGSLTAASLTAKYDGTAEIRGEMLTVKDREVLVPVTPTEYGFCFSVKKGHTYQIS